MGKEVLIITYAIEDELDISSIKEVIDYQERENKKTSRCRILDLFTPKMKDKEVVFCKTGVGKTNSIALLREILDTTFKYGGKDTKVTVLNLGTAASVLEEVGMVVECKRFIDRDLIRLSGSKYVNECDYISGSKEEYNDGAKRYSCNTGDQFATDPDEAHQMRDGWIAVCDMEAFPQKRYCDYYSKKTGMGIRFVCHKFISDKIGDNSVAGWEEVLDEARLELTVLAMDYVREFYKS